MDELKREPVTEQDRETAGNAWDYMMGLSNVYDLIGHVNHFEGEVQSELSSFLSNREDFPGVEMDASRECHNYSAWVRLYPELICNMAMAKLSRNELCQGGPSDYSFRRIAGSIEEKARAIAGKGDRADRLESMIRSFKLVIELRSCFQHGGLPRSIRKEAMVLELEDLDEVALMAIPQSFEKTQQAFLDAKLLLDLLPQPTIHMYQGPKVKFE